MCIYLCTMAGVYALPCFAQCKNRNCIWDSLITVESNSSLSTTQQLQLVLGLKKQFELGKFPEDSVFARILHRIGLYEYLLNNNIANNDAILNTIQAAKINNSGSQGSCKSFAVNSYFNLGVYYESVMLDDKALSYYDSTRQLAEKYSDPKSFGVRSRFKRVLLLSRKGDYQKVIEESTVGIMEAMKEGNKPLALAFFNHRANSFLLQHQLQKAAVDADSAVIWAKNLNDQDELANAFKTRARVYALIGQFVNANTYFAKAISARTKTGDLQNVAFDYVDLGNYYLNTLNNYSKAEECYLIALTFSKKPRSFGTTAIIEANLSALFFYKNMYTKALQYNTKSLLSLMHKKEDDDLGNPSSEKLNLIDNKELLYVIFGNKTETLTWLYKQTKKKAYLDAALKTAMLTDTLLTNMRHAQTGEQSKLYWRDTTKAFYRNALEACYLANNIGLAFYFMERSRGILLNDALNELGASAQLPTADAAQQEKLQVNIIGLQQKMAALDYSSPQYKKQEFGLLQAKDDYEHFIKSLEQKYPSYYQYKYADNVPSLSGMQKYLAVNNQSFIHYFISDTVAFILATTSNGVKFIRLSANQFNPGALTNFQQFCSNKKLLQNSYPTFARLANTLYSILFKPLQIPPGKVIICGDDFLVPFEAFCTDTLGKQFLVYNYAFSYVYSASYLLKKLNTQQAGGNFLGVAPVSFASYNHVADLNQSADALKASQQYYSNSKLLLLQKASRQNFFTYAPSYAVVTVFSHASADTTDKEPVIFMHDSAIHLSQLLYINKPATQLVILSACQTSVGKKATGEGIYSLARGFSAAGIPTVAATLWLADDQAIYSITQTFNRNIAQGFCKDVALQNAKLAFMRAGSNEKLLPYYWANMIIAGNVQPVRLVNSSIIWLIISVAIAVLILGFFARVKLKK